MAPALTPSIQSSVCTAPSGIIKKRPRRSHTPPKSSDLDNWSSRLRARQKSSPTQTTELQMTPKTSQSLFPESKDFISKRARCESSQESKASPSSLRPTVIHPVKPLTKTNLELLQESMSNPTSTSKEGSAPHRRISALTSSKTSSKRSLTATEVSETSSNSRAYPATSLKFKECLIECGLDDTGLERPNQQDLETLRSVLARERDSPEPDGQTFHLTRAKVIDKNEVSIAKR